MSAFEAPHRRRGQPLAFLGVVVVGWVALRAAFWTSPFAERAIEPIAALDVAPEMLGIAISEDGEGAGAGYDRGLDRHIIHTWHPARPITELPQRDIAAPTWREGHTAPIEPVLEPMAATTTAASHNLMWMAAMSRVPVPENVAEIFRNRGPLRPDIASAPAPLPTGTDRFSADGWLFLREGGTGLTASGFRAPSYGRSQAGAVLRYRLAPQSTRDPHIYGRASAALVSDGEKEVALGLSAKPIAGLPLRAHAELRATRQLGKTEARPSAFVTTGVDGVSLPLGVKARGYGQAGYVGGDFATAFADGFVVAEREIARFDLAKVRAGAGIWGGAQKGVSRLDVGPSASLEVRIGEVPARLSVDYRLRVAGEAAPNNGAALTLSTGF